VRELNQIVGLAVGSGADVEHDRGTPQPVFRPATQYRPAQRLSRKLELEGLLWIS